MVPVMLHSRSKHYLNTLSVHRCLVEHIQHVEYVTMSRTLVYRWHHARLRAGHRSALSVGGRGDDRGAAPPALPPRTSVSSSMISRRVLRAGWAGALKCIPHSAVTLAPKGQDSALPARFARPTATVAKVSDKLRQRLRAAGMPIPESDACVKCADAYFMCVCRVCAAEGRAPKSVAGDRGAVIAMMADHEVYKRPMLWKDSRRRRRLPYRAQSVLWWAALGYTMTEGSTEVIKILTSAGKRWTSGNAILAIIKQRD